MGRTRLRRSDLRGPGIRRIRRGRGFSYVLPDGSPVTDEELLARIKDLVIPPAWRDVWICPHPNGHVQAVGTDVAGRRQYRYHDQWRRDRDEEKHDRVLAMARRLPGWRESVAADLAGRGLTRKRVLAAALRMLDRGIFRTGGEEYAEENGTHGVATLLREHASVRGDECRFRYVAKGGLEREVAIRDAALAAAVKSLLRSRSGSDRLLCYREGGTWHEVHASDVNERFKELAGEDCTAKDLRTWTATVLAAAAFAAADPPTSESARKRAEAGVMREVSRALGNTPAVCRSSYVDPRLVEAYRGERTIAAALKRAGRLEGDDAREVLEKACARLLKAS
ncbi:DNA topoisomerase IB [Amycolatopsis sp. SID8362]|uniref:DNA topoisomerase IB n=1 Tax=Amycolatopsis sp. SID8362 TaxID=2690346 RepID=UPI00136A351B|nr:DNA topoisomerase IB [Amycolatopsis sp. SID8362]NBH05264.1 DNA topoisomerase IB [Amycolatopsis sp. SID8362]NED41964.1 DNA topoisomerase IB [Amycolatopsis sp. SID8362]